MSRKTQMPDSAKYKSVKKRLLVETGIVAGIVAIMSAGAWGLGMLCDDYQNQSAAMEGEVNSINTQTQTLRQKFTHLQKDIDLYHEVLMKNSRNELSISRQQIYQELSHFKARYDLSDLRLTMGAFVDLAIPPYKLSTSSMVGSDLTVELSAPSDEHVYSFLDALQKEMPGAVEFTKITLGHDTALTNDILRQIAEKGTYSLVKGTVRFTWLGVKPSETAEKHAHAH